MKRLLRDKRGMTLTEILVAITILMIVIVGVTPIMLSSYDSLYTAGEYTRDTYEAKSEIEDTLATRNSLNIYEAFKVNFEGLGEVAAINGKRAVSSLYGSLETIFTGGRAHVTIVSSKVINDDKHTHDVILQTTNITFKTADDISCNTPSYVSNETRSVDVSVYIPDKTRTNLASIYASKTAGVTITKATPATGRIYVKIQGLDFTNSPAKIEVTYRDENNKVRKTSCYLTIKTPTIMLVGSTNYADYYTSAGVETFSNPDGSKTSKLIVDARQMDISGSSETKEIPAGTVFRSVNWITEQTATTGEFVESVYEPSYYVLTGTNGAIYRTYTFEDYNAGSNAILGKVNLGVSGNDQAAFKTKFHNVISQQGQDVLGILDQVYILDDAKATTVYPAIWGGDFSHIFGYSAYEEQAGYTNRTNPNLSSLAWYTENVDKNGTGQAGYYSNFANFAYYYNGWALSTPYYSMNSRKISYILTEVPYAMRVGGFMGDVGSVDNYGYDGTTYDRIWEQPNDPVTGEHLNEIAVLHFKLSHWLTGFKSEGWYYGAPGQNFARSTIISSNKSDDGDFDSDYLHTLPVYFVNNGSDKERRADNGFAQLRLKALTTISPTIVHERGGHTDSSSDMRVLYNTNVNKSEIIVTDAVYLPATSTTSASVFYVGSVAAYGWITQVDNCGTNDGSPDVKGMQNTESSNTGWPSFYWIKSDSGGTQTTIFKSTVHSDSRDVDWDNYRNILINNASLSDSTPVKANSPESHNFFVAQPASGATSGRLFSDVLFTLGYASNREMVYTNIVYGRDSASGKLIQSLKFCEPFYFQSHYDNKDKIPTLYMNGDTDSAGESHANLNIPDNDYYNVWFPGEMYNLTKVATKDGVTVSVGYAVSGSAYSYLNTLQNASTGLGGIHNDGVLAAMVLGKDTAFTNLLYFKDTENFDDDSLSSGEVTYKNYASMGVNPYGTHARDSVQFTSVDISIEYVLSGNSEVANYYAYYADSKGRLYKSLVATKTTDINATSNSTPKMVSYISDKSYPNVAPSYMQEIQVDGRPIGDFFNKITSVSCEGDYIIVGGHSADGNLNLVIGKIQQSDDQLSNTVTWKLVRIMGKGTYQAEDILILDGYAYITGVSVGNPNFHKGFVYAMSLDDINRTENGGYLPFNPNLFVGDDQLQDRIYAIDGHSAS